jgi:uncharacterized protein (TIGR02271 family)
MAKTDDLTTLVCLFHHQDQAQAAVQDLLKVGVSQSSISMIDRSGTQKEQYAGSSLADLGVPERDQKHLLSGVHDGGVIVAVSSVREHVSKVEGIFGDHRAKKIDEAVTDGNAAVAGSAVAGETAIPIVEEDLVVGKRTVDQGGVRVYRRIVEIPVEESVNLREEHVNVERRPVNRAVTDQDLAFQGDRTIELTETAEEAVISKNARVVEEVRVGKDATERTEHIHDSVRKTEVEIEEIGPDTVGPR